MQTNRRTVLKVGGGIAALSMTGLAGCSGLLGGGEKPGPADYRYDPSVLVETENKFFGFVDYASLYEARDYFPSSMQDSFTSSEDSEIAPKNVDSLTGVGGAEISLSGSDSGSSSGSAFGSIGMLGSFKQGTIKESLQSEGDLQQSETYEGFTLYENVESVTSGSTGEGTDTKGTAAIKDGVAIFGFTGSEGDASASVTGTQAAKAMIDAGNGDADRLAANSDRATQLTDRLGESTVMLGGQINPALIKLATSASGGGSMATQFVSGLRAGGFGMTVDGETTTMDLVALYEDATAAEESGVKELVELTAESMVENSDGLDSIEAKYDGKAAVITVEGKTKTIFEQGSSASPGGELDVADPTDVGVAPVSAPGE